MADRQSRKRERTRNEILEAARSVARERGLAGLTLDEVAQRLGLTKAALYYYFRSKNDLAFELFLDEWQRAAEAVHDAVECTATGADALAALVSVYVEHYRGEPELFLMTHSEMARADTSHLIGPEQLARIRPINDLVYGPVEERLKNDQTKGLTRPLDHPRRLAFVAHLAAIGLLTYKTLVESVGDPLRYGDEELIEEITGLLRTAVRPQKGEE